MKPYFERYRQGIFGFFMVFAALLLRMCWFEPEYYLQLDDYIHYRNLAPGTDPISLCIENGMFASRPLASLLDLVFWGRIPLFFGSVLLCGLYAAAGILFWRLFRKLFGTGVCFLILFSLFPLGFEGTYWHAAATRILPPIFFTALAVTELDLFVSSKRKIHLPLYLLWSLLSFCFYEQVLVLSLALSLMLVLVYLLDRKPRSLWGLSIFFCVILYFVVTGYFSELAQGQLSARMNLKLPTDPDYWDVHMTRLLPQLQACFQEAPKMLFSRGMRRSMELIVSCRMWGAFLIPFVGVLVWFFARSDSDSTRCRLQHLAPLFGLLAALAPVTPFFIIADPWLCLRNTVPSFLGLALLVDYALRMIFRRKTSFVAAILAVFFMTASVSELWDYRMVYNTNKAVAEAILAADDAMSFRGSVGILGLNQSYSQEQNYTYHDHVTSAHASEWALTGLVRYFDGSSDIPYKVMPLAVDGEHYSYVWNRDSKDVGRFDILLLYDHDSGSLEPLTRKADEDGGWLLYDENGVLRARVWLDEHGFGRFAQFDTP